MIQDLLKQNKNRLEDGDIQGIQVQHHSHYETHRTIIFTDNIYKKSISTKCTEIHNLQYVVLQFYMDNQTLKKL